MPAGIRPDDRRHPPGDSPIGAHLNRWMPASQQPFSQARSIQGRKRPPRAWRDRTSGSTHCRPADTSPTGRGSRPIYPLDQGIGKAAWPAHASVAERRLNAEARSCNTRKHFATWEYYLDATENEHVAQYQALRPIGGRIQSLDMYGDPQHPRSAAAQPACRSLSAMSDSPEPNTSTMPKLDDIPIGRATKPNGLRQSRCGSSGHAAGCRRIR
jgi:hypothetical protein